MQENPNAATEGIDGYAGIDMRVTSLSAQMIPWDTAPKLYVEATTLAADL